MECKTGDEWERWAKLARDDPQQFEKERLAAIERLIRSQPAGSRHRSRQLQWKIDAVRQTSKSSMGACIRICDMLFESVYGPRGLLAAIRRLGAEGSGMRTETRSVPQGRIVQFREKKGDRCHPPIQ